MLVRRVDLARDSLSREDLIRYRPDVDGLRAVAVLSVLFFHYDFQGFTGGFVGVDVFFVISGFLITRLIISDIISDRFSFSNFYVRRARRLFPAMFFTMTCSFLVAILLFDPHNFERFCASLVFAIASGSNFLFWSESGYFDTGAHLKPLLHTWSLSVEEQYYLVWPALLVGLLWLWGKRAVIAFLSLGGFVSLVMGEQWLDKDAAGAFYLAPFRVFEFAIGGLCVWLAALQPRNQWVADGLAAAGLMAIAGAVVLFDRQTPFPGFAALLPCAGAAAIIHSGERSRVGAILRSRVAVRIGLWSYSLYLVHWPLWVYCTYWWMEAPGLVGKLGLVVVALVASGLMYRFIETPFRGRRLDSFRLSPPAFGLACMSLAMTLMVPAAIAWSERGWSWRYADEIRPLIEAPRELRDNRLVAARNRLPFPMEGRLNGLIIGDSHATDILNALEQNDPTIHLRRWGVSVECQPVIGPRPIRDSDFAADCDRRFERLLASDELRETDYVIFSARWKDWAVDRIPDTLRAVRSVTTAKIIVFGPTVEFQPEVPVLISRHGRLDGLSTYLRAHVLEERYDVNNKIRAMADELDFIFVDKISSICDINECIFQTPDLGYPVFVDYGHWSMEGAAFIGARLRHENPKLEVLFN